MAPAELGSTADRAGAQGQHAEGNNTVGSHQLTNDSTGSPEGDNFAPGVDQTFRCRFAAGPTPNLEQDHASAGSCIARQSLHVAVTSLKN